jgi:hypothetical protein
MRSPGSSRFWILALFIAAGAGLTAFEPTREALVGPLWLAGGLIAAGFYLLMIVKALRLDRLRQGGVPARAVARSVAETGFVVHEMPRVEMDLEVAAPGGSYTVTKKVIVPLSELERLRRGDEFAVRVDPGDRDRLAFEWDAVQEGPRTSWIARAGGGSPRLDPAALAKEAEHLAGEAP